MANCPELDEFITRTLAMVEMERAAEVAATQEASDSWSPEPAQVGFCELVLGSLDSLLRKQRGL